MKSALPLCGQTTGGRFALMPSLFSFMWFLLDADWTLAPAIEPFLGRLDASFFGRVHGRPVRPGCGWERSGCSVGARAAGV